MPEAPLPEVSHAQGGMQGWEEPGTLEVWGCQNWVQAGSGTHLTALGGWTRCMRMAAAANLSTEDNDQIASRGVLISYFF